MNPVRVRIVGWDEAQALALPLRMQVFVQEQGVPVELEHDEWDARSVHAIASDGSGCVVGTGRLLPDGHIGRMAVARAARGLGVGSALLAALIEAARRRGLRHLALSAQVSAVPFYSKHGFAARGAAFLDAGIEHVTMTRTLAP